MARKKEKADIPLQNKKNTDIGNIENNGQHRTSQTRLIAVRIIIIALALCAVGAAIFWCKIQIDRELQSQIEENLCDLTAQNIDILENELKDTERLLEGGMRRVCAQADFSLNRENTMRSLSSYAEIYGFDRIIYTDYSGYSYSSDGYLTDSFYPEIFELCKEGNTYISGALSSPFDKREDINLICVPVYSEVTGQMLGIASASFPSKDFQEILNVKTFNGAGKSIIVKADGTLISDAWLDGADSENAVLPKELTAAMQKKESGLLTLKAESNYYVYYSPMAVRFDNQEAYLLTAVPTSILDKRTNSVVVLLNRMLLCVCAVFSLLLVYYILIYGRNRRQLSEIAYTDQLTGGKNLAWMKSRLEKKKNTEGYLIGIDLKDFHLVNYICGVERGNEMIRQFQAFLCGQIRKGEAVAHMEGDCFILFLEKEKRKDLLRRLDVIDAAAEDLTQKMDTPDVHPCYGIYAKPKNEPVEISVTKTREALRNGKKTTNVHYAFYDEMNFNQITWEKELEGRFEGAIKNREFEVWYQPEVDAATGKITGAEALVRWREEDGTLIPPFQFIPVLEANGTMVKLDEYVFTAVCQQQKEWQKQGKELIPISVNVSPTSLYFDDILKRYKEILRRFELPAKYVPLEITESSAVEDKEILDRLNLFTDAGFLLHLDDFGSGYSSLSTLNVMRFETIKLAKGLIDHIADENGATLVEYIIKMAESIGITTTAEGVESKKQADLLLRMNCTTIQGFYFSKPLPLEQFDLKMSETA